MKLASQGCLPPPKFFFSLLRHLLLCAKAPSAFSFFPFRNFLDLLGYENMDRIYNVSVYERGNTNPFQLSAYL